MTENKNDFTKGNIASKLLRFMIPILGALILQAMYGAVDILVVGRFGTTAGISGVSTGSSIVCLPMSYFMSIQPGASLTMIGLAAPCATIFGIAINLLYFMKLNRKMKNPGTEAL